MADVLHLLFYLHLTEVLLKNHVTDVCLCVQVIFYFVELPFVKLRYRIGRSTASARPLYWSVKVNFMFVSESSGLKTADICKLPMVLRVNENCQCTLSVSF